MFEARENGKENGIEANVTPSWLVGLRRASLVILAVILGLSLTMAVVQFCSKPKAPKFVVKFVGVTNDFTGTSFAVFSVRATGLFQVHRMADPVVELRHQTLVNGAGWFYRTRLSPGGQAETVRVIAPKTQDEWRVVFRFCSSGLKQRAREIGSALLGIQMPSHSITLSEVHSDWMEPGLEMDWIGSDWMKPSKNPR